MCVCVYVCMCMCTPREEKTDDGDDLNWSVWFSVAPSLSLSLTLDFPKIHLQAARTSRRRPYYNNIKYPSIYTMIII